MISVALRELIAAGVTGDALVTAVERMEEAGAPKRTAAAERMVRYRVRQKEASRVTHVTHGDALVSPKETSPTPPKEITPSAELRSDKYTKARASRIPETFSPDLEAAYAEGLSEPEAISEAANFCDYWRAKSTNATKLDWPATWRVWCRKSAKDRGSGQGRAPPRQRSQNGFAAYALELAAEQENGPGNYQNGFHTADDAGLRPGGRKAPASNRILDAERSDKAG